MKKYTDLFWDWDHTIWDFETNSKNSLLNLYEDLGLAALGLPVFDALYAQYLKINEAKWDAYRQGAIDKATLRATRFPETFGFFGVVADEVALQLEERYLAETPFQKGLMPGAAKVLAYRMSGATGSTLSRTGFRKASTLNLETRGWSISSNSNCAAMWSASTSPTRKFTVTLSHMPRPSERPRS